jgi:hypothetical protein
MNKEDQTEYSFRYADCEGKVYNTVIENPGATWMEALDDYVRFLESIYKYDIRSQVRIQEPKYQHLVKDDWGYIDPWTGEYFVKEEVMPDESPVNIHQWTWDEEE